MIRNQFLGINPLLHSDFQSLGGWEEFHNSHLTYLTTTLRSQLLPLGYIARLEDSLQIRAVWDEIDEISRLKSDVTIYDTQRTRFSSPPMPYGGAVDQLVLPTREILRMDQIEPASYRAVGIYKADQPSRERKAVAWIELLSPTNKPGGRHSDSYQDKRFELMDAGLVYVELDYLHESPPTFDYIPDYTHWQTQPTARAYRIMVVDARLTLWDGTAYINQFDIDTPIPTVTIPLSGADQFDFDFNAPYQKTYEEMLYGQIQVKYDELPANFERYSRADQARILTRLLWVRDGQGAERIPAPLLPLSLEEASGKWSGHVT